MQFSKFIGKPYFGHSMSFTFAPYNWIVGLAFGPKWIAFHIGPFNVFWHRPKNIVQRTVREPLG